MLENITPSSVDFSKLFFGILFKSVLLMIFLLTFQKGDSIKLFFQLKTQVFVSLLTG